MAAASMSNDSCLHQYSNNSLNSSMFASFCINHGLFLFASISRDSIRKIDVLTFCLLFQADEIRRRCQSSWRDHRKCLRGRSQVLPGEGLQKLLEVLDLVGIFSNRFESFRQSQNIKRCGHHVVPDSTDDLQTFELCDRGFPFSSYVPLPISVEGEDRTISVCIYIYNTHNMYVYIYIYI